MIFSALNHISVQLNQFLKRNFNLAEDVVVMTNILEQDGSLALNINNKLLVFLVNLEKENAAGNPAPYGHSSVTTTSFPPLHLNLYVMVAANFSGGNYPEALKFLSSAISFFQRLPIFDHQSTPDLDKRIDKLVMEVVNLNLQDMGSLWGVLSGKYLPSVLYKVRMVSFDSDDVISRVYPVLEQGRQVSPG